MVLAILEESHPNQTQSLVEECLDMSSEVKVTKLHPAARVPSYAHRGPFGDLAADVSSLEAVELSSGEIKAVSTGIAFEFPPNLGAIVHDRSGLAMKGVATLAGVIDPGYRGELKVVLINLSGTKFRINAGDRIAQLRIVRREEVEFTEVNAVASTERDVRGFGSTGR
jgi:dUTP pyrophosphatase